MNNTWLGLPFFIAKLGTLTVDPLILMINVAPGAMLNSISPVLAIVAASTWTTLKASGAFMVRFPELLPTSIVSDNAPYSAERETSACFSAAKSIGLPCFFAPLMFTLGSFTAILVPYTALP